MKERFISWLHWLRKRPIAIINLVGIIIIVLGGAGTFLYLLNKPIDVLENWTVSTTKKEVDGKLPSYTPGGTLEFVSTSTKLISAEGTTTRIFDCDATSSATAREIALTPAPANRAPGYNAPKENSIIVPAVNEFNGLPRTCRVVFNVCYQNVVLWRDHCETARTNDFLVEEMGINPAEIRQQIDELNERIRQLEAQLVASGNEQQPVASTAPPQAAAQAPTATQPAPSNPSVNQPNAPATPADDRSALGRLPLVGGLFDSLGL